MTETFRIMVVIGTRPEAIKMAPVISELKRHPWFDVKVCITSQHREMLAPLVDWFGIRPDYDLNVMTGQQTPNQVCAQILTLFDDVLAEVVPSWVLVQGDTTTAMAASLAAFHRKIPVGHIEAGLRSYDNTNPFPEEMNRRVVDVIADLYFAPTKRAVDNLINESAPPEKILLTGNTVVDALLELQNTLLAKEPGITLGGAGGKKLILVTAHRRESFGEPLQQICQAIKRLAESYRDTVHIVFPVHLNPAVQSTVYSVLSDVPNVQLTPPLDYPQFISVMRNAYLILSDSGGVQEEAPSLGVPVLVMRSTSERPEAIEAGVARLVGTNSDIIFAQASEILDHPTTHAAMAHATNPFGNGQASKLIVRTLSERLRLPSASSAQELERPTVASEVVGALE